MDLKLFIKAQSGDARLVQLQKQLMAFYQKNSTYYNQAESQKDFIYEPILSYLNDRYISLARPIRVIELGAGRTFFPAFVKARGQANLIEYVAHDINDTNVEFYRKNKIDFVCGGWPEIHVRGYFDLFFSTYVFEHLVEPHLFLRGMSEGLTRGGAIIIISPKYGFPFYVPPAVRWLPKPTQLFITLFLLFSNIWTRFTGTPKFWICVNPAVFKQAWRRDYDAIHMVSIADVKAAMNRKYEIRRFPLARPTLKMSFFDQIITLSVIIRQRENQSE